MTPLTTLPEVILSTLIFVLIWILLRRHVLEHGPIPHALRMLQIHNGIQVVVSIYLVTTILLSTVEATSFPEPLQPIVVAIQTRDSLLPRYSYHLSKMYEYVDIILFVSKGGHSGKADVDLHFGFHHLTTPYLSYFRFLNNYEGWRVFSFLNAFHHILMYSFFAGVGWTHVFLPFTGFLQLIVGMLYGLWIAKGKIERGQDVRADIFAVGLLFCYFVMHTRETLLRRTARAKQE